LSLIIGKSRNEGSHYSVSGD